MLLLCLAALTWAVVGGVVELRRQGRAREMLALGKAARLAATATATECYATGKPFADFSGTGGFAAGVEEKITTLGCLAGTVRLLQTDATGYGITALAYREGPYLAVYDTAGGWQVWSGTQRIALPLTTPG